MPNPLSNLVEKHPGAVKVVRRVYGAVVGIAQDFWKDGKENPFQRGKPLPMTGAQAAAQRSAPPSAKAAASAATPADKAAPQVKLWHAEAGEISEKMWGEGFVTPGDPGITDSLVMPRGLNNTMSVLDLSAGLGGRMRAVTEKFGVFITGLEPDAEVAARGMEMSIHAGKKRHSPIAAYDPESLSLARKYDFVIARETFYRVVDKNAFFAAIAAHTKPDAHISFTDYIVNPEDREKPAVVAWQKFEKNAAPLSLVEMAEAWAKVGFTLNVHDDQTEYYKKEITKGLKQLAAFLATGIKPDAATKASLVRRTQTWVHRMAAMEQGMKFMRFYGIRK